MGVCFIYLFIYLFIIYEDKKELKSQQPWTTVSSLLSLISMAQLADVVQQVICTIGPFQVPLNFFIKGSKFTYIRGGLELPLQGSF